jgi:uncharacterized HAD superfamily protein
LKLLVDIDGVLTNLPHRMIQVAQEKFGKVITPEDIYRDDEEWLTKDELTEMFQPEFFFDMEPYEHNIEALRQMTEDGHEIHFVTARPESDSMFEATVSWFDTNGVPTFDSFTFHHNKALVAMHLGLEGAIEDFSSNANDLAAILSKVYLVNQPYNLKDELQFNVVRVNNLWEVRASLQFNQMGEQALDVAA